MAISSVAGGGSAVSEDGAVAIGSIGVAAGGGNAGSGGSGSGVAAGPGGSAGDIVGSGVAGIAGSARGTGSASFSVGASKTSDTAISPGEGLRLSGDRASSRTLRITAWKASDIPNARETAARPRIVGLRRSAAIAPTAICGAAENAGGPPGGPKPRAARARQSRKPAIASTGRRLSRRRCIDSVAVRKVAVVDGES